jgi:hypothetical protein
VGVQQPQTSDPSSEELEAANAPVRRGLAPWPFGVTNSIRTLGGVGLAVGVLFPTPVVAPRARFVQRPVVPDSLAHVAPDFESRLDPHTRNPSIGGWSSWLEETGWSLWVLGLLVTCGGPMATSKRWCGCVVQIWADVYLVAFHIACHSVHVPCHKPQARVHRICVPPDRPDFRSPNCTPHSV